REDIYFCLECKLLNVVANGQSRAYAAEYVTEGMIRFITGQYAKAVRHGGMLAYVLDGDVGRATANVAANIQTHGATLCVVAPVGFLMSSLLPDDARVRETHYRRPHDAALFCIHHLFMAR